MAKQLSWKQQVYQSLANSHVQQVMQQRNDKYLQMANEMIAQQQAIDDKYMKMANDMIAEVQSAQQQQPVQQEPVQQSVDTSVTPTQTPSQSMANSVSKQKKQEKKEPKKVVDFNKEDYQRQQQEEQMLASQGAMKGEKKWQASINDTLNRLNSKEFQDVAKKGKANIAKEEQDKKKKEETKKLEKQIASFDKYNTDNMPQLTDQQKALEEQILNSDRYVPDNPNKDKWNNRFLTKQEKENAKNNTTPEDVARWISPETKLTNKEKGIARAYAANEMRKIPRGANNQPIGTEEEKQHYADMLEILNKTNPITSAANAIVEGPFNLVDLAGAATRSVGNQLGGLGAAVTDKMGITEGATQSHNEKMEAVNEAANLKEENMRRSFANSQTQYPLAYGAGKIAGQVAMYSLTNPVFDGIAEGAGVSNALAKFFINQGAQNAQDLVLDTAPLVKQLMADGSMSDADKREVFNNILLNALGNAGMGVVQEAPNIAKFAVDKIDAKQAARAAANSNITEGAFKLARLANDVPIFRDADNVAKKLPVLGEADDVVTNATRQAEEAVQNIQDIAKQMPEIPDEDIKLSDAEINKLVRGMEPAENAAETVQNVAKTQQPKYSVDTGVDNPNLTRQANDEINSYIYQLEDPFHNPEVDAAAGELVSKVTSEEGFKLLDDYASLSKTLRESVEDNPAIREQLAELRKGVSKIDKAERDALKDYLDYVDIETAVADYKKALNGTDTEAVSKAANALDAARNRVARRKNANAVLKNVFGGSYGPIVDRPKNAFSFKPDDSDIDNMVKEWTDYETNNPNRFVRDAVPENQNVFRGVNDVPGANPLQTFAGGSGPKEEWVTSKYRTNTIENMGWGDQSPIEDYAYRRFKTQEQHEVAIERGQSFDDLVHKDSFDAPDMKASMEMQKDLLDSENFRDYRRLSRKTRFEATDKGETIQALAEYNKNTAVGALQDAQKAQDDIVNPWKSKNVKAHEGNSRIAKALADMGHNEKKALKPELTHDQIKKGVIAELEREVGSVEKYFNDNDIEFLTQLAEDKSIPVWQITSEIEHKLNTGNWYTLDESIELPKPTNAKLQNALNSLVEETVRAEKEAPSLKQITEEVRNTLDKELSGSMFSDFTDDDIDYLANLIREGASKDELVDALDIRAATGGWGISDETLKEVNNIFKDISRYDVDSKQFVEGQAKAYEMLANELLPKASLQEKFEAWRYLAMLGNPKTMLRNFIGNATFNVVTSTSNSLSALLEAGIDRGIKAFGGKGIQRTKAILNPLSDGGLIKAAWEDADISRYRQINGTKYEKMDANSLRQAKSVFDSKLAQFYEKVTDAGISDYHAVKVKYSTSLAGYMKANGMDTSIFKAEDELKRLKELGNQRLLSGAEKAQMESLTKQVSDLNKARDFALKQAEYATFHEDNAIANALSKASRYLRNSNSKALNVAGAMLEGIVPFKKTPANVLRSGLEYSPLGAIDSIRQTGKLIYENTGIRKGNLADVYINKRGKEVTRTLAADVIDSWSKTLTGSGLTALGYYLYNKGVLNSSDKDLKYQDQLEGKQNYSIKINGKTYTIDWAAPSVMPLLLGAEIAKVWRNSGKDVENWYDHLDEYLNAANRIADPIIETSMLQGVKDTLETAANAARYDEDLNIPALIAYNTLTGYATQAVPTLGGQIARTIDPTRRSTYSDKEGVAGTLEKQGRKLMNKIPGLSYLNQPYVDTYGRTQKNSPFNNPVGNLAYQMLSPGYLAKINQTSADKVSREVYDINKDTKALPQFKSSFEVDGNKVSPEDYTKGAKIYGEAQQEMRAKLYNDSTFKNLDPEQKEEFIKKVNTLAEKKAMESLDPNFKPTDEYTTYKKTGINGLLKEYKHNADYTKAVEEAGIEKSAGAKKAFEDGGAKAVVNFANQQKALDKYGLKENDFAKDVYNKSGEAGLKDYKVFSSYEEGTDAYKRYEKAKASNSSLTASSYNSTLMRIDGLGDKGKKNGSITQDEMISYLNKINASQQEADRLWKTYGKFYANEGNWAKIPVLEGGKWKAKKKK